MFQSRNAKRFRALFTALIVTVAVNYGLSFVANATPQYQDETRSGVTTTPNPPKPIEPRSGVTTTPNPPKPVSVRSGVTTTPNPPKP